MARSTNPARIVEVDSVTYLWRTTPDILTLVLTVWPRNLPGARMISVFPISRVVSPKLVRQIVVFTALFALLLRLKLGETLCLIDVAIDCKAVVHGGEQQCKSTAISRCQLWVHIAWVSIGATALAIMVTRGS